MGNAFSFVVGNFSRRHDEDMRIGKEWRVEGFNKRKEGVEEKREWKDFEKTS